MALVLKDRVKETTTTTGTGTITLAGAASGFDSFSSIGDGNTTYYAIVDAANQAWEVGIGTYTASGTTLSRDTVLESSNSDALVDLQSGTKTVFCTLPAEKAIIADENGLVTLPDGMVVAGDLTVQGTTTTIEATNLAIADNMIYLRDGETTGNVDLGFAGNYNDGTYAHAGFFRDATDGRWKVFDGYTPEPDAATDINTAHASFALADVQAANFYGNLTGDVTGNADTADALSTARTISVSGDVSGSVSFDGSANADIAVTVADDSHNHVIANVDGLQTALDAKQAAATAVTTATSFGGDVSGTYDAIVIADDSHNHVISNIDGLQTALDAKLASSSYTAADVLSKITTVDGSGSGLDADTVDGIQASSFLRSDANDTATGIITFQNSADAQIALNGNGTTWAGIDWTDVNGTDYMWFNGQYGTFAIGGGGSNVSGKKLHVDGGMSVGSSADSTSTPTNGIYSEGAISVGGSTVWHAGNDGSGSGLDADTLDGSHASAFQTRSVTESSRNINILSNSTGSGGLYIGDSTGAYRVQLYGDGANAGFLTSKWGAWGFKMDSSGNCTATGNVTAYSDERLKDNVEVIDNAVEKVKAIRGVTYNRNDIEDTSRQAGVIAQEVEKVFPEVVAEDSEGTKTVAYGNMVGLLIEAIKDQQVQIDELKAALESK